MSWAGEQGELVSCRGAGSCAGTARLAMLAAGLSTPGASHPRGPCYYVVDNRIDPGFPRKSVLAAALGGLDYDLVPEPLEALDGPVKCCASVALVEIVAAEVLVDGAISDDSVGDDQNGVCHRDERAFAASPGRQTAVLRGQVRVFGMRRGPCGFDQRGTQPRIAWPDMTASAFTRTLIVAWAHARPRREVGAGRKPADVGADLRQDGLGYARSDAWDGV